MSEWVNAALYAVVALEALKGALETGPWWPGTGRPWRGLTLFWLAALVGLDAYSWACLGKARGSAGAPYGAELHLIDVLCALSALASVVFLGASRAREASRRPDRAMAWGLAAFAAYCLLIVVYWAVLWGRYGPTHPLCKVMLETWAPSTTFAGFAGGTIALYGVTGAVAGYAAATYCCPPLRTQVPFHGRIWPSVAALLGIPATMYAWLGPTNHLLDANAHWPAPWRYLLIGAVTAGALAGLAALALG